MPPAAFFSGASSERLLPYAMSQEVEVAIILCLDLLRAATHTYELPALHAFITSVGACTCAEELPGQGYSTGGDDQGIA